MSRQGLYYLHGPPIMDSRNIAGYQFFDSSVARPTNPSRIEDAPRLVQRKKIINPTLLTEGELLLSLTLEKILINKSFYGDAEGKYIRQENMIYNAVKENLHRIPKVKAKDLESKGIANAINQARKLTKNAQVIQQRQQDRIAGFDPYSDDNLTIEEFVCEAILQQIQASQSQLQFAPPSAHSVIQAQINQLTAEYNACVGNHILDILNNHLEESGHNFSYAYLSQNEILTEATSLVSAKFLKQKAIIQTLASFTSFVSNDNMQLWLENGILRQNVIGGEQPFGGKETSYSVGLSLSPEVDQINLDPATVALILGLAQIVLSLVKNAVDKSKQMKDEFSTPNQIKLGAQDFGTDGFNVQDLDWTGSSLSTFGIPAGGGGTGGSNTPNNNNDEKLSGLSLGKIAAGAAIIYGATQVFGGSTNQSSTTV